MGEGELRVESRAAQGLAQRTIKLPSDLDNLHRADGWFWGQRVLKRGASEIDVLRSIDGRHWHLFTRWQMEPGLSRCRLFRLGEGFLAIGSVRPFQMEGKASRFAYLKAGSGERLLLDRLLPEGPQEPRSDSTLFQRLFVPWVMEIPQGWAVLNFRTGDIWMFRATGEGLNQRFLQIFPEASKDGSDPYPPLLGCALRPEGTLLLATRSEDAVKKGMALAGNDEPLRPGAMPDSVRFQGAEAQGQWERDQVMAQFRARSEQGAGRVREAFPEVLYWDLDPETGRLTRCPPPQGAPSRLLSEEAERTFTFRFRADGSFSLGYR